MKSRQNVECCRNDIDYFHSVSILVLFLLERWTEALRKFLVALRWGLPKRRYVDFAISGYSHLTNCSFRYSTLSVERQNRDRRFNLQRRLKSQFRMLTIILPTIRNEWKLLWRLPLFCRKLVHCCDHHGVVCRLINFHSDEEEEQELVQPTVRSSVEGSPHSSTNPTQDDSIPDEVFSPPLVSPIIVQWFSLYDWLVWLTILIIREHVRTTQARSTIHLEEPQWKINDPSMMKLTRSGSRVCIKMSSTSVLMLAIFARTLTSSSRYD